MLKAKIKDKTVETGTLQGKHVPKYPYLGIYEGKHIVLFTSPSCGYSITGSERFNRWEYSDGWVESNFKKFNGKITIGNEEGWEHEQQSTSIS